MLNSEVSVKSMTGPDDTHQVDLQADACEKVASDFG